MENLKGRVAVVTGASKGIGKAIAITLAKCGANLVLNYRRDEPCETLNEVKKYGVTGIAVKADVSIYEEAEKLIDTCLKHMGKIDILVNNAGVSHIGLFMDMKEKDWNNVIDVDIRGVINCTHSVLKYMASKKYGNIVNISSIWGNEGASCEAIYSAAKGAVNSFTKAIAKEMAPSNIRANAVAPGVIDTEMNSWLNPQEKADLLSEIPLGRFGTGEEIGSVVAFLCSESSRYITGKVITVDGGMF
ncbi:3-oxoacyl-[acyl-carrier protein] reductase [Clostridium algifaecis]|uniref:3-oxoacyl-[acyl-carrier protein] reductase n=1 Tax=Clostridium algifaecis TaxID=1472040 RepID=A0ABS4KMT8_9CLOT|nr:SDR family oxidoreductase [Clostridium algifaecis]MBP2031349.1 3-oxoacyl-[acyl-carrier protein] reductase [Clostridium algifaecis]